jgi:CheY-like chemotaxis protein
MAPEVVAQVFEPFFSTKPQGEGTGLGLSMVYGFVKQSGGHVKIYSEVGQGTTIKLYLPRVDQSEDVVVAIDTGPIIGGPETILVAEDDEEVRTTVVDMLTELGYRVLKAKDAASALTIVESGMPIDLLFTDVVMPGTLRSPELARMARERCPISPCCSPPATPRTPSSTADAWTPVSSSWASPIPARRWPGRSAMSWPIAPSAR